MQNDGEDSIAVILPLWDELPDSIREKSARGVICYISKLKEGGADISRAETPHYPQKAA